MTLGSVILGTIAQLMFAYFLFMLVVFSACSMAGNDKLARVHSTILTLTIYGLPASSVLSAGIVIHLYRHGAGASSWWWHALPVALAAIYLIYAISLNRRMNARSAGGSGAAHTTGERE
ncbi:hypothetical protein LRK24_17215 [Rhodanobacter denitrificans]|uniref:hypothetical protein n=1 Tax=Rhodanobacter denitrificans TaxID=666685 RepID=UPI000260F72C|nr:hypothetical protein [Rhodanobacter denitrificans]EIM01695.1 hypothetical protein UUC_10879 [Rhodanobacter denitrificans]UJM90147.1 hypothetical protein LRK24_17215 [Rhodanobacter denitrificans]